MIGDIITFKNSVQADETPIPIKVIALGYQHSDDENEALVQIGNDETCDIVTIDEEFVGYPLTAEILEKNGFDISDPEVKQYHFEEDGQRYHFSLRQMYNQKDGKPNGYSFFAFNILTIIDYVHELQHAMRLCDIKKEIEL